MNVWFKMLSRLERNMLDLTINYVSTVKSRVLSKILINILSKISFVLNCGFLKEVDAVGRPIAQKFILIAKSWGNKHALNWIRQESYVECLGMNAMLH